MEFYAPDWEFVLIWSVVALLSGLLFVWMGGLFGRAGAIGTSAVVAAGAMVLWLLAGPAGSFYLTVFAPPVIVGALIGVVVWSVCLAR
ncbi:hypothetical protein [Hyphomicrobium sp.]|uniref:hypothetical protein n=1 Tax=Hyphomicrobium sp. TaxID=82 RepID=UPI003F70B62C